MYSHLPPTQSVPPEHTWHGLPRVPPWTQAIVLHSGAGGQAAQAAPALPQVFGSWLAKAEGGLEPLVGPGAAEIVAASLTS